MALDPRAILAAAPPAAAPVDIFGSFQRGLSTAYQARGAEQHLHLQQLQVAEQQRKEQERRDLGAIYRRHVVTDPATGKSTLDLPSAISETYRVNPQLAFTMQQEATKTQAEASKSALEARKLQLEQSQKQLEFGGQVAAGVKAAVARGEDPQAAWEWGINTLRGAGFPIQGVTPTYDANLLEKWSAAATDAKTKADMEHQALTRHLEERRLQETQQHHRALEQQQREEAGQGQQRLRLQEREVGLKESTAEREQREAAAQVPEYVKGQGLLNATIQPLMQRRGLTGAPPPEVLEEAAGILQQRGEAKAAAVGKEAARLAREDKPLEGEVGRAVSEFRSLQRLTDDATELFDPSYTGALEGRWGATRQWLGKASDREVVFRRVVKEMTEQLGRARSGANIPPAEYARLESMMPTVNDPDNVFKAKLLSFRRSLDQAIADRLETATTARQSLRTQQPPVTPLPGGRSTAPAAGGARPLPTTPEERDREIADIERQLQGR